MKEYIKKFGSASSADNYVITDIPFTSTVFFGGGTSTNLTCNQKNKKIDINGQGNISIVDAGPSLISFIISDYRIGGAHTYQAEEGMTWTQWIESEYNIDGFVLYNYDNEYYVIADSTFSYGVTAVDYKDSGYYVDTLDIITNNYTYCVNALDENEPH